MDYMGAKGSGTRNREVLRNQEKVKMLLRELSTCCQMQVGIILERKFNTNIERLGVEERGDDLVNFDQWFSK